MRAKNYRRTRYSVFHLRCTTFFFSVFINDFLWFREHAAHFSLSLSFARLRLLRGTQEADGVAVSVSICSQDLFGWRWFHLHVRFYRASKTLPCIWIKLFETRARATRHIQTCTEFGEEKSFSRMEMRTIFLGRFSRKFSAFCQMYWEQSRITSPKEILIKSEANATWNVRPFTR